MTSLEERTDTNVRLSILLNCRKALLAVLLRSVEKEGRERQRERDSGERRGGGSALPSLMTAMLRPYALHPAPPQTLTPIPPIVPGPVPSTITAPVPAPDAADVTSVPVTPRPVSVPVTPRPTQAGTVPVPPVSLAVDPTPAPQTPTPVELDRAPSKTPADVGRDLVVFIRLMSFRGSPTYSTGLEFLSIDDVTAIGSQQKVITVDIILGRFLATILESDYHPERSASAVVSSDIVTAPECSVNTTEGDERTFLTAVRTALLHTLITTVSGGKSTLLNCTVLYCTALCSALQCTHHHCCHFSPFHAICLSSIIVPLAHVSNLILPPFLLFLSTSTCTNRERTKLQCRCQRYEQQWVRTQPRTRTFRSRFLWSPRPCVG